VPGLQLIVPRNTISQPIQTAVAILVPPTTPGMVRLVSPIPKPTLVPLNQQLALAGTLSVLILKPGTVVPGLQLIVPRNTISQPIQTAVAMLVPPTTPGMVRLVY